MSSGNYEEPFNYRHACAACKHQRKKCEHDCIFAAYYPPNRANYFREVHKIFGVKNMTQILEHLHREERLRAVESLEWEAFAWKEDPVNGPLGTIRKMEKEIELLRNQLIWRQTVLPNYQTNNSAGIVATNSNVNAANFGCVANQNLALDRTMNQYGVFRHSVRGHMTAVPVPYYPIRQGEVLMSSTMRDAVAPRPNILPKPETQRINHHQIGNQQAGFHASSGQGSFSGSQGQGKSTFPYK